MDQKPWLWRKRSAEKTLTADKANTSFLSNEEDEETQVQEFLTKNRILNDKLPSALSEINFSNNVDKKQVKTAQEAIAGWEKAEAEAKSLKQDLDIVLQQKAASEERSSHLEAALKECTQQLRFVREEQEKRVHNALTKTSQEFEKTRIASDKKLADAYTGIATLDAENAHFKKALSGKDKVIEELSRHKAQLEADLKALTSRVGSTERENASLKYEVCVLEKELEIRHEEREVNQRATNAALKQQQESVKKIAKLESECQRLRLLVRKRLPGPATLAKMKSEVGMIGEDRVGTRRRKSNPSLNGSVHFHADVAAEMKRVDFLTEQLQVMEEENRSLRHALNKTVKYSHTKSLKGQTSIEPGKETFFLQERSLATLSDLGSDDKASCSESWASSALISEVQHFKNEKQIDTPSHGYMGTPDMNLMDDFAEMEKLAVVSVDNPDRTRNSSEKDNAIIEVVHPDASNGTVFHTSSESSNHDESDERKDDNISDAKRSDGKLQSDISIPVHKIIELLEGIDITSQDNGLAESFPGKDGDKLLPLRNPGTPTGYTVRVFQWKTSELSEILLQFVQACYDLLNGKANLEQFAQLVASSLDWVMNHCFSLQDVSSMKEAVRSQLHWDELRSESEAESGSANHSAESSRLHNQRKYNSSLPMVSPLDIKPENDSSNIDFKGSVQPQIVRVESFSIRLQDSKNTTRNLQSEMETSLEGREACQTISHLENNFEKNGGSFQKLEETFNDLVTELKSEASKETPDDAEQLQNEMEITAASEKLAECQETILNLGKQLKALASSRDTAPFDKVISAPADSADTRIPSPQRNISQRLSLLDKMLAEDNDETVLSPSIKDDMPNGNHISDISTNKAIESWSKFSDPRGNQHGGDRNEVVSMAIVPSKKNDSRSFWKKLLWGKRKMTARKHPSRKL